MSESKREEINLYYDFYGCLLTKKQQNIFVYYYREDYSLSEIAENEGISRAAVSDALKRCRNELFHYEELLHLVQQYTARMRLYQKIKETGNEEINRLIDACIETENEGGKYE